MTSSDNTYKSSCYVLVPYGLYFLLQVIDEADRMIDSMNQDWLPLVTKAVFKVHSDTHPMLFARKEHVVATVAK